MQRTAATRAGRLISHTPDGRPSLTGPSRDLGRCARTAQSSARGDRTIRTLHRCRPAEPTRSAGGRRHCDPRRSAPAGATRACSLARSLVAPRRSGRGWRNRRAGLVREFAEETGLVVEARDFVGEVVRRGPDDTVYRIRDFLVTVIGGTEAPGDDAADSRLGGAAGTGRLPTQCRLARCAAVMGRVLTKAASRSRDRLDAARTPPATTPANSPMALRPRRRPDRADGATAASRPCSVDASRSMTCSLTSACRMPPASSNNDS